MIEEAEPQRFAFSVQGLTHVSWQSGEYGQPEASLARQRLAGTGANWAGVLVTWYMDRRDSTEITPDPQQSPTDADLARAISELRSLGLRIMLKPHVDVQDGTWRGDIRPSDEARWFDSYRAFLLHHAAVAQSMGVDLLCIGTELVTMSDASHAAEWFALIDEVRTVFPGALTYAANATASADEFTSVAFWDRLDVLGLDAYPPLTNELAPTRAELVRAWRHNQDGDDIISAYRRWQEAYGKPVVLTEIGYRSADGTNRAPWDFLAIAAYDPAEQADCYAAAFEAFSPESAWMQGFFWWNWPVRVPDPGDTDYTPWTKPAESILREWYTLPQTATLR